ncbi:DNA helicase Rep [endosymbiont of unidentified scaly snail isolate Monju]|uniref:DNA helicase Rep n=1 Tax=endosymbiont of unidentified scaly snail isolate Monju TaxID=1248727 RepID=UPI0003891E4D|nr:DNA helicase Rep [endosymbiont of unidentified scaly snail isolate Monju]BAN69926.1 ATP-dependent DNA helicase Rep [endosymbiont of unidentified scaly snail isolate Monju]
MHNLNPRQREAVRYLDGPCLVLAGAGSGKTRVITAKIAHLVEHAGIAPRHLFAVTFTNKAAREMKSRVEQLIGGRDTRGLNVSTFHTFGLNLLRRELAAAGLRRGFSILDEQDVEQLLRELSKQTELDRQRLQMARHRISAWKNELISPEAALSRAEDDLDAFHAALYGAYQEALRAYNALDFDDLILRPVQLLEQDAELRERWQNRVRHLLVDEYQDTNGAQYRLVQLLVGVRAAFTVVGDDDQSIYAWRGARPENLARLKADYPQLAVIKLEQNYRSTGRILRAANTLIANNPHVFEKRLWSELGPGEPIRVIHCRDEEAEADRVASEIVQHRFRHGSRYGDFAILYRGNHQARAFEKALRTHNIPYFLSGGTAFFSRTEIKDLMAYLRLLANPDDDTALLRIINTPRREIGHTTLQKLAAWAAERNGSLFDAIDSLGLEQQLAARPLARLREFREWLIGLQRLAEHTPPANVLEQLLDDLEYRDWLSQQSSSERVAERRWENVRDLVEWLQRLQADEHKGETLPELVAHLSLMDILERQDEDEAGDRVALMTLHAAKGLEFPVVFLVGMEEGLLPHQSSIEDDDIEEERRLAYVGITRARRELIITTAEYRRRAGERVRCEPSRFLQELPADDLQQEGRGIKISEEERHARGLASLANLKAMLEG